MFSQLTMGVMLIRGVNVHFTTRDVQSCDAGAGALLSPAHVLGARVKLFGGKLFSGLDRKRKKPDEQCRKRMSRVGWRMNSAENG